MKYTTLPGTAIQVSKIALGTMTFGQQNSESEGHSQLDFAIERGINFVDTAEMYSVPTNEKTYGVTEEIIGNWFKKSGKRDKVVLATKIGGPNRGLAYMRDDLNYTSQSLELSVDKSLRRLQTDYIDLYQLHWPERKTNMFGQRGFKIEDDSWQDNFNEVLQTLQTLINQGKIKQIGISNETPWGLMRFLEESKKFDLPKTITIQNPYSLLNRTFEIGLSEVCFRENVGLLAYSPLAFGVLSGKFLTGESHPNARINLFPQLKRYSSESSTAATIRYKAIANNYGLSLTAMALAFVNQQPFLTSNIIGATTLEQLAENINSVQVELSQEILNAIELVQNSIPNPAP